jgi:hypothetical protein
MPSTQKKPSARQKPRLARGSLRAQAWLHSALWPLHEALTVEVALLEAGNLTWRHAHARLEDVREAAAYLAAPGRVNLADLVAVGAPELEAPLAHHAAAVQRLAAAAAQAQAALVVGAVRDAVSQAGPRWKHADATLVAAVAEDVVNNALDREVLGHESDLWHAVRPMLAGVRHDGRLAGLEAARGEALEAARALLAALNETRARLCDAYDLPPAPIVVHTVPDHQYR